MKSFYLLSLFCFSLAYAQEKIPVKHQKWNFTSFQEGSVVRDKKEGILLDNVSLPEIELYKAKGDTKTNKAMVICPGGGLYFLAYEKEGTVLAKKLASKGITAVVLKYRTYPREGSVIKWMDNLRQTSTIVDSAKTILPYSTKDALGAIEMIRKNASKYEVDPNKIGLMGFSAGGAVTMQAAYEATENNQPNFIAPIYPWMAIVAPHKVPSNKPPAFISCANDDPLELASPSVTIYEDWIAAGAEADLHMFSKGGHGFGTNKLGIPVDRWSDLLVDWILSL